MHKWWHSSEIRIPTTSFTMIYMVTYCKWIGSEGDESVQIGNMIHHIYICILHDLLTKIIKCLHDLQMQVNTWRWYPDHKSLKLLKYKHFNQAFMA
jgi:hypothetical protein